MTNADVLPSVVYVVDDEPGVLKMLQALLATMDVDVRTFSSATEFLEAYRPMPSECLVCDLRMPDIDGIELQKRLKEMDYALPIIFLTGFAEVSLAVEAMRNGAIDFLEKPFSAHGLLGKTRVALDCSKDQYAKWREGQARNARLALLTATERKVIRQVTEGKSSREISEMFSISVRTVENHRTRIMEKLHVKSAVQLVRLFR